MANEGKETGRLEQNPQGKGRLQYELMDACSSTNNKSHATNAVSRHIARSSPTDDTLKGKSTVETPDCGVPKDMPVLFTPPSDMFLSSTEKEVAEYIFANSETLDGTEHLVNLGDGLAMGDRKTMQSLMPTGTVTNEFMRLVVCLLNSYKDMVEMFRSCWFFPPEISHGVLNLNYTPAQVAKYYGPTFMGFVDNLHKIFIPIKDDGLHWYLILINVEEEQVVLLDSNPFDESNIWRKLVARKMSIFIQEMLMDRSFYGLRTSECPAAAHYTVIGPQGLSQNLTSYHDSGVQVAKWMMECISDDNYEHIVISTYPLSRYKFNL
ncbi:Ulp1 protease family, C-terminal catalytic domain [Sesbania bispinosa]|nr:Ulp1 protease family, C-terminal catalytic domain [Sesbania bispinosa]